MIEWRNASSRGRPGAEFGEEPRAEAKRRQALGSELGNQEVREGLSGGAGGDETQQPGNVDLSSRSDTSSWSWHPGNTALII